MERPQYDFPAVRALLVFAIASLFAGRILAQASGGEVAESLKGNVVRIKAQLGDHTENGFGFIVGERSGNLYIVTANHVVYPSDPGEAAPKTVKVEFFDHQGEPFEATVLGTHDTAHDLAVLTIPPPTAFQWTKACLGRAEEPKRSTDVWFIGKGQEWYVPTAAGHVANDEIIDGEILLDAMQIVPGSSGGPLLDSTGIVGIILRDSAENATALEIKYVKSRFKTWNHPFNLDRAAAAAPAVAEAPKPAAPEAAPPVSTPAPAAVPAANPLHDGYYELYKLNGQPQQGRVLMRLQKASDDHFLAKATTASDNGWSGELLRSGDAWDLKIVELQGRRQAREGSAFNPGSGKNEISKEGPLLTFKSDLGTFVWMETDKTAMERPASEPQPASSSGGAAVLNALISGFAATRPSTRTTDQCVYGYVWREAGPNDHVCVTPETRQRTAIENSRAAAYRDPNGRYGPETCVDGYVWRDAFAGDHVCVSPQSRLHAAEDNNQARARIAH
jgi:hypothetical protein